MARKKRITKLGYYHVISHGVEKHNVFLEDKDYTLSLDIFTTYHN